MEYEYISIFGYGTTSLPLVKWLNENGIKCKIYDDKFTLKSQEGLNTLLPPSAFNPLESKIEITSPGIMPIHPYFSKALHKIGEYDFITNLLDKYNKSPLIVWISGTNGKTTTTQMLTYLLESSWAKAGGNIGTPLIELFYEDFYKDCKNVKDLSIDSKDSNNDNKDSTDSKTEPKNTSSEKIWILETSSFSMHYAKVAKPKIYLLLPIREDHISWHGSFEGYINDKLKVLERMESDSYVVLPKDLGTHRYVKSFKGKAIFYADSSDLAQFLGIEIKAIAFDEPFLQDALLALCGAKIINNTLDIKKLNTFYIGAHRIEEFRDSSGLLWVDDSKGTNTDATLQAIKKYAHKSLYVILGGDDKGADCEIIFTYMRDNAPDTRIFTIGKNESKLLDLAKKHSLKATPCGNLKVAIDSIKEQIKIDGVESSEFIGLLSPAAASLDQFKSYKQRGKLFKKYVLQQDKNEQCNKE